jgi:hypothetical protein
MTYPVQVDIKAPAGVGELDPLQREGVASLLDGRIAAIASIQGPDEMRVDIEDYRVAVYPSGALLLVLADAPALEFAEEAVRQVVASVLQETELLADWSVVKARVELNDELALESLAAAEGPNAPPADPRERTSGLDAALPAAEPGLPVEKRDQVRAKIDRGADLLAAFGPADFGVDEGEDAHGDGGGERRPFAVPRDKARLAAGAIVYAIGILIDELFQDIEALAGPTGTTADAAGCIVLGDLPPRYADQYTGMFAKRFLVTVVSLTARLTAPGWAAPASVAEELALRLLIEQAEVVLDLYDLADHETARALAAFRDAAFEDLDSEDLYDDEGDDDAGNLDADAWFAPFDETRSAHLYAHDPERNRDRT